MVLGERVAEEVEIVRDILAKSLSTVFIPTEKFRPQIFWRLRTA
jgi:hypothetical protein